MSFARSALSGPHAGIWFILAGMLAISVNDMMIKFLSDRYPLHELVLVRSGFGIVFSLAILQFEGGWRALIPQRPWLQLIRALLIVCANLAFFMGLASMPLADATALFFVAPLLITLMSAVLLGERVGPRRIGAVVVGFLGVLVMVRPGTDLVSSVSTPWVLALPILAAAAYAGMQVLTRFLGAGSVASAMAVYLQGMFILVSLCFFVTVGDGRFAEDAPNEAILFILRPWVWPELGDWPLFLILGVGSAIIGYALAQAYRLSEAATVAPFEYASLPLAIFWGWAVFGTLPGPWGMVGIVLIAGSGVYVFLRERRHGQEHPEDRPIRRG